MRLLLAALVGYLLGALPVGVIVGRVTRGVDLRQYGSGKMGATNALRTLGKGPAALVVAGDLAKGALAVAVARRLAPNDPVAEVVAGGAAAVGHSWSVFIRFGGGRSVLVGAATLIMLSPAVALRCALAGIATIAATRYVSLGSLVGAVLAPVLLARRVAQGRNPAAHLLYALAMAVFIVVRHRDNIARLRAGTERKLGQQAEKAAAPAG